MLENTVEVWVKYNYPNEDGVSQHDLVIQYEKGVETFGNKKIPINGVPQKPDFDLPVELNYFWDIFQLLGSSRETGMGTNPIYYSEIKAWSDLTGVKLSYWEISVIKRMDSKYLQTISLLEKERDNRRKSKK